jgi:Ran GTPase-activating protein (RanGAP) involved in mRNA processing and transport
MGLKSNTRLEIIHFSDCGLVDKEVACLVDSLKSNGSLRRLFLNGNVCRSNGIAAISKLLSSPENHLRELDISGQAHDRYQKGIELSELFKTLFQNESLKTLALRECNLTDDDLRMVVDIFCSNTTLENVDLQFNHISPDGIKSMFAVNLPRMKGLKRILLRQRRGVVHEDVRDALLEGLKGNVQLERLDLFQWANELEYLFNLNRAGRRILKERCFPLELWPLILARTQRVMDATCAVDKRAKRMRKEAIRKAEVSYYLLRYGPLMMERCCLRKS